MVEIEGLEQLQEHLKAIDMSSPEMRKRVQKAVRRILGMVRAELQKDARSGLKMKSDPRKAYKAVRYAVYKRILGGQVNILQSRKASSQVAVRQRPAPDKKRGGNRWGRSERTNAIDSYTGRDRGFILRFLNAGAGPREIHSYTGRDGYRHDLSRNLSRGSIEARDWFGRASQAEMERRAGDLDKMIQQVLNEEFNLM